MTHPNTPHAPDRPETINGADQEWAAMQVRVGTYEAARRGKRILATYAALEAVKAENARLVEANESVAVCAKHTADIVDDDGLDNGCFVCDHERLQDAVRNLSAQLAEAQAVITEAQASYVSADFAYKIDEDETIPVMILRLSKDKRICGDFCKDVMPDAARSGRKEADDAS